MGWVFQQWLLGVQNNTANFWSALPKCSCMLPNWVSSTNISIQRLTSCFCSYITSICSLYHLKNCYFSRLLLFLVGTWLCSFSLFSLKALTMLYTWSEHLSYNFHQTLKKYFYHIDIVHTFLIPDVNPIESTAFSSMNLSLLLSCPSMHNSSPSSTVKKLGNYMEMNSRM